jgi:cytochrome P450
VREGGSDATARFAEEVLRLYPSVHFIRRIANRDFEVDGTQVAEGDSLIMLDAGANRDHVRFPHPGQVDLARDAWREHLTFSVGPHTCAGAALARAEVQEVVAKCLERLPNLRLDPEAEQPRFRGFLHRTYHPLHALFDAPSGPA